MFTYALAAVTIALAITIVAQFLCSAGLVTTDMRNLCLTAFLVWCGVAMVVFVFGVFATIEVVFR